MDDKSLQVIGQAELVDFPGYKLFSVPARIDTGARTSAIWATDITLKDDLLSFKLFGKSSEFYSGKVITATEFSETIVASSIGEPQKRYKVIIPIRIKNKRILANFTLANRSTQVYPLLIGRNTLRGKFIVNVKAGTVLKEREKLREAELKNIFEEKQEG